MIQQVVVISIVVFASAYLVRTFYLKFSSKNENCDGCAVGKAAEKI